MSLSELLDRLGVDAKIELPERAVLSGGPVNASVASSSTPRLRRPQSTPAGAEGAALTATREVLEAIADPAQPALRGAGPRDAPAGAPASSSARSWRTPGLTCDPDEA